MDEEKSVKIATLRANLNNLNNEINNIVNEYDELLEMLRQSIVIDDDVFSHDKIVDCKNILIDTINNNKI